MCVGDIINSMAMDWEENHNGEEEMSQSDDDYEQSSFENEKSQSYSKDADQESNNSDYDMDFEFGEDLSSQGNDSSSYQFFDANESLADMELSDDNDSSNKLRLFQL